MDIILGKVRRLTPEGEHWFFGYYDIPGFSIDGKKHLCHHVNFCDRLPKKEDAAELAVIDIESGKAEIFARSYAWNFQQGSMLQWHPLKESTVIYNDWRKGQYIGVERNLNSNTEMIYDRPVANVSPNGKYALSVNFDRIFDFRAGYGYCQQKDPWAEVNVPGDDGVWLVCIETGHAQLIIPYSIIYKALGNPDGDPNPKLLVNHIAFNTDGTRFIFLVRNFCKPGRSWKTALLTADTDGSNLFKLADWGYASHYHWRDPSVIAVHSGGAELGSLGNQLYELTDKSHSGSAIDPAFFLCDGHNSYSPDRARILYDSYPDKESFRHLYLYNIKEKRGSVLGSFYSPFTDCWDIRCDLHPLWSPDGRLISFDSVHEGFRGFYIIGVP